MSPNALVKKFVKNVSGGTVVTKTALGGIFFSGGKVGGKVAAAFSVAALSLKNMPVAAYFSVAAKLPAKWRHIFQWRHLFQWRQSWRKSGGKFFNGGNTAEKNSVAAW